MNDLSGHTALFVGGTSGIGRASATLYHARGGAVVLGGRSAARLEAALDGLGDRVGARGLVLDVTDEDSIATAFEALAPDSIDHLVITAANLTHGPFAEQSVAHVQAMFESKFWGAYRVAKAALPLMRDGGAIVLVSGVLSRRPGVNCVALGAACAALEALARALALELGPRLRANCVAPGMVRTELHDRHPLERREAMFESTGSSLPVGRVGLAAEIGEAIIFAATNGYLTGQTIDVDGGHTIRQYATR
jgi:NAD(P)-dependent dehydrogenase (short-subunit alcohol dehydrogenase family)